MKPLEEGKTQMGVVALKCLKIDVTVHQFGPFYRTEIIAIVHCMYADDVVCGGVSCVCAVWM